MQRTHINSANGDENYWFDRKNNTERFDRDSSLLEQTLVLHITTITNLLQQCPLGASE